jgi:hypothetical protein
MSAIQILIVYMNRSTGKSAFHLKPYFHPDKDGCGRERGHILIVFEINDPAKEHFSVRNDDL